MKATENNLTELSRKLGLPANVNPSFEQMREAGIEPPSRPKAPPTPPPTVEFIGKGVGQVVCKGDIRLGSGCGSCTRCRRQIAVLIAENERLTSEVRALEEKTVELNFDAARYCYLATTTWSDEVTDALCTSDKDQIDQAVDAELMRASA